MNGLTSSGPQLNNSNLSRLVAIIAICLLLKFLCANAFREAVSTPETLGPVDFVSYYEAAERLNRGSSLYSNAQSGGLYVYTPLLAQCLRFTLLHKSLEVARRLWLGISIVLLCVSMLVCIKAFDFGLEKDLSKIILVFVTGFRYWPTVVEFAIGNSHMVLLALVSGMLLCNRHKRWILLGLLIGVAAAMKTWCILFVSYLIICRQRKAALAALGSFAALTGILLQVSGPTALSEFLNMTFYVANRFSVAGAHDLSTSLPLCPLPISHSIFGVTGMFLRENCFGVTPFLNSALAYGGVLVSFALTIIGGLLYAFRLKLTTNSEHQLLLNFCILSTLLLVPVCHVYTIVLALPSIWALTSLYKDHQMRYQLLINGLALLSYLILAMPLASTSPVPPQLNHGIISLTLSLPFLAVFLLWCTMLFALSRSQLHSLTHLNFKTALFTEAVPSSQRKIFR